MAGLDADRKGERRRAWDSPGADLTIGEFVMLNRPPAKMAGMREKPAESEPDVLALFSSWVDQVLTSADLESVVAFNFNLYEHVDDFCMQLVGCNRFDPNDHDWACYDVFSSGEDLFELPVPKEKGWEEAEQFALKLVAEYLRLTVIPAKFHDVRAVGVGFVDGDLHVVYQSP